MSSEDTRTWNLVGWFEIYVTDIDQAKAVYGDVAQCDFTPAPMSGGDMEMWFFGADPSPMAATWLSASSRSAIWVLSP